MPFYAPGGRVILKALAGAGVQFLGQDSEVELVVAESEIKDCVRFLRPVRGILAPEADAFDHLECRVGVADHVGPPRLASTSVRGGVEEVLLLTSSVDAKLPEGHFEFWGPVDFAAFETEGPIARVPKRRLQPISPGQTILGVVDLPRVSLLVNSDDLEALRADLESALKRRLEKGWPLLLAVNRKLPLGDSVLEFRVEDPDAKNLMLEDPAPLAAIIEMMRAELLVVDCDDPTRWEAEGAEGTQGRTEIEGINRTDPGSFGPERRISHPPRLSPIQASTRDDPLRASADSILPPVSTCLRLASRLRRLRLRIGSWRLGISLTGPPGSGKRRALLALCAALPGARVELRIDELLLSGRPDSLLSAREKLEAAMAEGLDPEGLTLVFTGVEALAAISEDPSAGEKNTLAAVLNFLIRRLSSGCPRLLLLFSSSESAHPFAHIVDEILEVERPKPEAACSFLRRHGLRLDGEEAKRASTLPPPQLRALCAKMLADVRAPVKKGFEEIIEEAGGQKRNNKKKKVKKTEPKESAKPSKALSGSAQQSIVPGGFSELAGLSSAKRRARTLLDDPRRFATLYSQISSKLPRHALLFGFSGCGKTRFARSAAAEFGLNLIHVRGPEVLDKYIGGSEENIRRLFADSEARGPSLLFFDEIDAVVPRRDGGSSAVTDRLVNQMLCFLDGVAELKHTFVFAASSRPELVDPALLRPGRIEVHLFFDLPSEEERKEFFLMKANSEGESESEEEEEEKEAKEEDQKRTPMEEAEEIHENGVENQGKSEEEPTKPAQPNIPLHAQEEPLHPKSLPMTEQLGLALARLTEGFSFADLERICQVDGPSEDLEAAVRRNLKKIAPISKSAEFERDKRRFSDFATGRKDPATVGKVQIQK